MENQELVEIALEEGRDRMSKAVAHLRGELGSIRTGRAAPALVEHLKVEVYGADAELRQLASVSVPEARLLMISPYDRGTIGSIEKAIQASDIGITPSSDGQVIRLAFPPLTEERRRELVKVARHKGEEAKVAVRNLRRSFRHEVEGLEHGGDISSDEMERAEHAMEKVTQSIISEIEGMVSKKELDLMEV